VSGNGAGGGVGINLLFDGGAGEGGGICVAGGTLTLDQCTVSKNGASGKGDSKKEPDETFYLDLFGNSGNSLFAKNRGLGTILNDD
jgi:hypothetical protein